ncbi:hypothetical protein J437_LFUL008641, partial [Ladona fulva]
MTCGGVYFQDCPIPPCPTQSFPGLWEVPLVAWFNEDGVPCAMMVMITFDDAVTKINFDYFMETLFNRKNPNGCNISATFFISHDYNDYALTHRLFRRGHEIALHSISHHLSTKASVEQLKHEFVGMKRILHQFAKIPNEAMKGIRSPNLQMSGDNTFQMMEESGIEWDSSWSTVRHSNPPIWPYTLDFPSKQ